jgi:hypothetical protein
MRLHPILQAVVCVAIAGAAPAFGQAFQISSPTPAYTGNTTLPAVSTGAGIVAVSGGGQTVTFSAPLTGSVVGSVGGWTVWGTPPDTETATPTVLATAFFPVVTSLTLTLSSPVTTFGLEIEPANATTFPTPTAHPITATFFNGATTLGTVTRSVTYNGARVFALSSSTPITSVQISAPAAAGGFAMGRFRFGNSLIGGPDPTAIPALGLPELSALALILAAAGALLARRQQAA